MRKTKMLKWDAMLHRIDDNNVTQGGRKWWYGSVDFCVYAQKQLREEHLDKQAFDQLEQQVVTEEATSRVLSSHTKRSLMYKKSYEDDEIDFLSEDGWL